VVVVGLTVAVPVAPVTVPTPLSIESEVAPLTDQLSVVLVPFTMALLPLAAVKLEMTGATAAATVTVALALLVPAELVAVSV
jgi:hypothetical protein